MENELERTIGHGSASQTPSRLGAKCGAAAVAVMLMLTGLGLTASPASAATAKGNVYCWGDYQNVVGIWVEVKGGGSGWARWSGRSSDNATWWNYDIPAGRSYQLHIGCGGTPQKWKTTTKSDWTTRTSNSNWTVLYAYGKRFVRAT